MNENLLAVLPKGEAEALRRAFTSHEDLCLRATEDLGRSIMPASQPLGSAPPGAVAHWRLNSAGVLNIPLLANRLDRRLGSSGEMQLLHGIVFPQTRGIFDSVAYALSGELPSGRFTTSAASDRFRGWAGGIIAGSGTEQDALSVTTVHTVWTRLELDAIRTHIRANEASELKGSIARLPDTIDRYLEREGLDALRFLGIALERHRRFEYAREEPEPVTEDALAATLHRYLTLRIEANKGE